MLDLKITGRMAADVERWAKVAADQIPFVSAVALTRTAGDAKAAIEQQLPSVIDRPTPWTLRGFRLWPARKTNLRAVVDFRDSFGKGNHARDYLAPQVFGGPRKIKAFERALQRVMRLPEGYMVVPGAAAKLDQHGNMDRGQIVQLLSYFRAFSEAGYRANITLDKRAAMARGTKKKRGISYFVGQPGGGSLPLGVWERTEFGSMGSSIKPLAIFIRSPTYRRRLDVPGIAAASIEKGFEPHLARAWEEAMRTRTPKGSMP